MRILIADDDAVSRRLLQSYLERWGHEVLVTENGAQAWQALEREHFPIVISDWMMPEMEGVELIRRIRQLSDRAYVYTLLVTSRAQKEDVVAGMEAGADDFLTKPFDRDELRVRLRAGERIVELEQRLAAQGQAIATAQEVETALAHVSENLAALRERLGLEGAPTRPEGVAPLLDGASEELAQLRARLAEMRSAAARESAGPEA